VHVRVGEGSAQRWASDLVRISGSDSDSGAALVGGYNRMEKAN